MLAFFVTRPLLPALMTGAIIAYLAHPFYLRTLAYVKNKNLASMIVSITIVLIITLPFVVVIGLVSKEAGATYNMITQNNGNLSQDNLGSNFFKFACRNEHAFPCRATKFFVGFLPDEDIDKYTKTTIGKITGFIVENVKRFLASIPSIILNFFVLIFSVYYLLKDGEVVVKRISNILPLKESHKQHVFEKFHEITIAVFYGNIAVAVIQGLVGAIGFFIFGVHSPILWGFVMMLFALIPYFGTAIVWLPAALNLIFMGYLQNDQSSTIRGVILIAYGIFVISTIDNVLKPKIIGNRADIHPILVLLGVLGGINLFGFIGIILGPVMLALLVTFMEIYEEEKADIERYF